MSVTEQSISVDLEPLFKELEAERELSESIREMAKELDRCYRSLASLLDGVHSTKGSEIDRIVQQTIPLFAQTRKAMHGLVELVPDNQYYRWCDNFSYALKNLVSAVALTTLLSVGGLVTKEEAAAVLGLGTAEASRVQLSTEDYLHGIINMINELSRLAVNAVTLGDFWTPVRLAAFVKHIHAGFQLLNLKNDSLRERFDAIKYDVKKIEEVVYDISLRGLIRGDDDPGVGVAYPRGAHAQQHLIRVLAAP